MKIISEVVREDQPCTYIVELPAQVAITLALLGGAKTERRFGSAELKPGAVFDLSGVVDDAFDNNRTLRRIIEANEEAAKRFDEIKNRMKSHARSVVALGGRSIEVEIAYDKAMGKDGEQRSTRDELARLSESVAALERAIKPKEPDPDFEFREVDDCTGLPPLRQTGLKGDEPIPLSDFSLASLNFSASLSGKPKGPKKKARTARKGKK